MIVIDGQTYNVPVADLKRKADFLDKSAERNMNGELHRELIGVYINYSLIFGMITDTEEYNRLWDKLTEPVAFHEVTVPGAYTFTAYFSNVSDELYRERGSQSYYRALTVSFTAQRPARVP